MKKAVVLFISWGGLWFIFSYLFWLFSNIILVALDSQGYKAIIISDLILLAVFHLFIYCLNKIDQKYDPNLAKKYIYVDYTINEKKLVLVILIYLAYIYLSFDCPYLIFNIISSILMYFSFYRVYSKLFKIIPAY